VRLSTKNKNNPLRTLRLGGKDWVQFVYRCVAEDAEGFWVLPFHNQVHLGSEVTQAIESQMFGRLKKQL